MQWLDFCDSKGVPVPESNPVMITLSAAVYEQLLECAERFQRNLSSDGASVSTTTCSPVVTDGDNVHLRFGGAAICEMLHLRCKQIKGYKDTLRNKLSEEITILQAMIMKGQDKSTSLSQIPRQRFQPDFSFIPFIQTVHETFSISSLGENTIEVCDALVQE